MKNSERAVIDLKNDITKYCVNTAIDWAVQKELRGIDIPHSNHSAGTRTFKPGTRGAELVPELLTYYESKGCTFQTLADAMRA